MSYDGIFTHIIVNELKEKIENGRISKIYQPFPHELLLTVRANRKNQKLLLSAHPSYARIQLTEEGLSNPDQAPNFCMFLRKNIEGALIEEISQYHNDRIVIFKILRFDELGDRKHVNLVIELMGRHSNIFLVDNETNKIMDSLKHVPAYQNSYRSTYPGADYVLPPHQDRLNPFEPIQVEDTIESAKDIQSRYQGIGRDSSEEIFHYYQTSHPVISDAVAHFVRAVQSGKPTLFTSNKGKESFTPYHFETIEGEAREWDSPSALLDHYYQHKASRDRIQQVASDLLRIIQTDLQKNKKKLEKLEDSLKRSESADDYRIKGEVLTAYLHQVEKGSKQVSLPNFYQDDEELVIDLNPSLTASQNAQKYFSRYHKLTTAVKYVNEQIEKTKEENDYLDSIETQINLSDPQDLEDIRDELKESGYLKSKRSQKNKKKKASKPHKFQSTDGTSILVGKNNTQNDELTLKKARNNHFWLHAKDIPGSHVIVESSSPSEETLLEAATIAAYYSKYQQSANVPVDYVEVKHVKKPNGAKPGFVIYTNQTTLFVTPSKEFVDQLRQ